MKIVQWELSCSMRTDGRTEMTKLFVTFRNFADALNTRCYCEGATNQGTYKQRLLRTGIVFSLAMLHVYQNCW